LLEAALPTSVDCGQTGIGPSPSGHLTASRGSLREPQPPRRALKAAGLYFSQTIIWDKQHPVLTRKDRMGRRVERVGFAWERGKVRKP
jgi:hypothetical protein